MFNDAWGLHSISTTPVQGKPFKARYEQRRVERLPGGQGIPRIMSGEVYRDSSGRVRQELHLQQNDTGERMRIAVVIDPLEEAIYIFHIDSRTYIKQRFDAAGATAARVGTPVRLSTAPAGSENEALGQRQIEGLSCRGYRNSSENSVSEVWYSDELKVALLEKITSPQAEDTWRLFDVRQTHPRSECFVVPAGYVLADEAQQIGNAFVSLPDTNNVVPGGADLNLAAASGDVETIRGLLKRGIDVDARSILGETALMAAAECGHAALVTALLEAGADVEARSKAGTTALMHAALNDHAEIVTILLSQGAKTDTEEDRQTPLMFAASRGHIEIVELLLAAGADVDAKESHDMTALMFAAGEGFLDVARALLAAGADVKIKNTDGYTALTIAGLAGQTEMIRLLEQAEFIA